MANDKITLKNVRLSYPPLSPRPPGAPNGRIFSFQTHVDRALQTILEEAAFRDILAKHARNMQQVSASVHLRAVEALDLGEITLAGRYQRMSRAASAVSREALFALIDA